MPSYQNLIEDDPDKYQDLLAYLGSLNGEE